MTSKDADQHNLMASKQSLPTSINEEKMLDNSEMEALMQGMNHKVSVNRFNTS